MRVAWVLVWTIASLGGCGRTSSPPPPAPRESPLAIDASVAPVASTSGSAAVEDAGEPHLACDDAPHDPLPIVRGKPAFVKLHVRHPVAGTKLEICLEEWMYPKTEEGHMLIFSVAVYEGARRVPPTLNDAGEAEYEGLGVAASRLVPGQPSRNDGLYLHLR
ncbi:MAG: hypothetical protein ACXVEF_09240 [Polyangiales bacterium]